MKYMTTAGNSLKPDSRPLYDQAIEAINQLIEQGGYEPGDKLPGEADLAKQLGISRPTLREAIGNLEMYGIVKRRHGVGTFVTAPAPGDRIRGGLEQLVSLRSLAERVGINSDCVDWVVDEVNAPEEIAEKLNVELNSPLAHIQMTAVKEDGVYIAYMESFISIDLIDITDLKNYKEGSMLNYLLERSESNLSYTQTYIYPVVANKRIAGWLKLPQGTPLQLLEETYYSDTGQSIMHEFNYFLADHLNFNIIRRIARL
jgi:GntR family transcriptional regulator